ncbi:unnamed protein product [Rhizoctonia solani]|uniref:Uncharacterized protein n=1 Tax=Rhizoctonia solani TaxID=456999 RepID=A0A8H3DV26_9AGAM|nr:unnamed protein product [Rhizoctonia solani]CAE6538166.1 unnamed protein product [Rhizoctonia solani]
MPRHPGSTYRVANASIVASRKLANRTIVRVQFIKEWAEGNPLFDWYKRLESSSQRCLVRSVQLRKESKQPFYHEYLVFCMDDVNNTRFRLERRQLENEDQPLNSLFEYGVEAYDSIEDVSSIEKFIVPSHCVAEIHFNEGIHLAVVLEICRAIHKHPSARVYTLQRFNCYFFAQTVLLCTARATYQSNDMKHMIAHIITKYDTQRPTGDPPLYAPPESDLSPLMLLKEVSRIPSFTHGDHCSYCWSQTPLLQERNSGPINHIQNPFWEGSSQVIQEVLHSINVGDSLQNVLWSTDFGQRLRDVCDAFMLWTVCDELETLQQAPSTPSSPGKLGSVHAQEENTVELQRPGSIEHDPIGTPLESNPGSQLQRGETRRSSYSTNHYHRRELTKLDIKYSKAREELVELVSQAYKRNEDLDEVLSIYHDPSRWPIEVKTLPPVSNSFPMKNNT